MHHRCSHRGHRSGRDFLCIRQHRLDTWHKQKISGRVITDSILLFYIYKSTLTWRNTVTRLHILLDPDSFYAQSHSISLLTTAPSYVAFVYAIPMILSTVFRVVKGNFVICFLPVELYPTHNLAMINTG